MVLNMPAQQDKSVLEYHGKCSRKMANERSSWKSREITGEALFYGSRQTYSTWGSYLKKCVT